MTKPTNQHNRKNEPTNYYGCTNRMNWIENERYAEYRLSSKEQ